jgi:hypothetical protein
MGFPGEGGGAYGAALNSCIVWNNSPDALDATSTADWSDIDGGFAGSGNINLNPRFFGPERRDLHLRPASPAINAGDPAKIDVDGSRRDMGAFPYDPGYCGAPGNYCTAKLNSRGCLPTMSWSGSPTLSGADDFHVRATDVLRDKIGIMIWSTVGPASGPFFGGTLCIAPSIRRSPLLVSTPTGSGTCIGIFDYHFTQAFMVNKGLQPGSLIYLQYWHRDPAQADGTGIGLTDGLEATICAGP